MLSFAKLLRPVNCLVMCFGVIVGVVLAAGDIAIVGQLGGRLWLAAIAAFCLGASANSINDYFDVEADRINRPRRPIPSEDVSASTAQVTWLILLVVGVVLSFILSVGHGVLALLAGWAMFWYSASLKRQSTFGNIVVALVVGLVVVYGAMLHRINMPVMVGAVFALLTTMVREIIKDIEDQEGDRKVGSRTIPIVHGVQTARRVIVGVTLLTVLLLPMPYLLMSFNGLYMLGVMVAGFLMLIGAWIVVHFDDMMSIRRGSLLLKSTMVIGMLRLSIAQIMWM